MLKAFAAQLVDPVFWSHARATLAATAWGFVLGAIPGTIAGLLIARFKTLETLLLPYVTMLNTMPRVALAPVFILWFGVGAPSKIAAAVSLVFFISLVNAMAGSRQIERDLDDLAHFLRCSEITRFANFVLPVAMPSIFAGMRLGVIYSLLGVVVAEMIAAQTGLGLLITSYTNKFAVSELFAVLLFLMIISTALNIFMERVEKRLLRWQGTR
jgi:NitT/TauT family transport system permease protein